VRWCVPWRSPPSLSSTSAQHTRTSSSYTTYAEREREIRCFCCHCPFPTESLVWPEQCAARAKQLPHHQGRPLDALPGHPARQLLPRSGEGVARCKMEAVCVLWCWQRIANCDFIYFISMRFLVICNFLSSKLWLNLNLNLNLRSTKRSWIGTRVSRRSILCRVRIWSGHSFRTIASLSPGSVFVLFLFCFVLLFCPSSFWNCSLSKENRIETAYALLKSLFFSSRYYFSFGRWLFPIFWV
jgi:hypothetical protein